MPGTAWEHPPYIAASLQLSCPRPPHSPSPEHPIPLPQSTPLLFQPPACGPGGLQHLAAFAAPYLRAMLTFPAFGTRRELSAAPCGSLTARRAAAVIALIYLLTAGAEGRGMWHSLPLWGPYGNHLSPFAAAGQAGEGKTFINSLVTLNFSNQAPATSNMASDTARGPEGNQSPGATAGCKGGAGAEQGRVRGGVSADADPLLPPVPGQRWRTLWRGRCPGTAPSPLQSRALCDQDGQSSARSLGQAWMGHGGSFPALGQSEPLTALGGPNHPSIMRALHHWQPPRSHQFSMPRSPCHPYIRVLPPLCESQSTHCVKIFVSVSALQNWVPGI